MFVCVCVTVCVCGHANFVVVGYVELSASASTPAAGAAAASVWERAGHPNTDTHRVRPSYGLVLLHDSTSALDTTGVTAALMRW